MAERVMSRGARLGTPTGSSPAKAPHHSHGVADDRTGDVIADLTGCRFLDSRGLGALIAIRVRLERADRRLALVMANQSVLQLLRE